MIFVSSGGNSCYPLAAPDELTQPGRPPPKAHAHQKPRAGPEKDMPNALTIRVIYPLQSGRIVLHNESSWASRKPIPFQFFFGKTPKL
jgi:hypothetical protein